MLGVKAKASLLHGPTKALDLSKRNSPGGQDVEGRVHLLRVEEQDI